MSTKQRCVHRSNTCCQTLKHFDHVFGTGGNNIVEVFEIDLIRFIMFNATFSNISAISWLPVLVVEEAGVPGENHRPWESNW